MTDKRKGSSITINRKNKNQGTGHRTCANPPSCPLSKRQKHQCLGLSVFKLIRSNLETKYFLGTTHEYDYFLARCPEPNDSKNHYCLDETGGLLQDITNPIARSKQ